MKTNKKAKSKKAKFKATFHEADQFWFGEGYWSINFKNETLYTTSQKLALKTEKLFNQKTKRKIK